MTCKRFALLDFKGHSEVTVAAVLTCLSEMGVSVQVAGTIAPDPVESFDPFADLNDEDPP